MAGPTKDELVKQATGLGIVVGDDDTKATLEEKIAAATAGGALEPSSPEEVGQEPLVERAKDRAVRRENRVRRYGAAA